MQRIQKILELEINEGSVKWEKLQPKIEAALKLVDNKFTSIREDDNEKQEVKFDDALTFRVKRPNGIWCYKLISPRFLGTKFGGVKGGLFASGVQKGVYDEKGFPVFPFPPVLF